MASLFCELGFVEGVEVGTREGAFAKKLCTSNPNLSLTCVDPYMEYGSASKNESERRYKAALETLVQAGLRVQIMRQTSMEAVNRFKDSSLDFVFIDGNHDFEFVMEDIVKWSYKVKKGGIVAVHDYHPFVGCDVMVAVNAYTRAKGINPWYVTREQLATAYWVKP